MLNDIMGKILKMKKDEKSQCEEAQKTPSQKQIETVELRQIIVIK